MAEAKPKVLILGGALAVTSIVSDSSVRVASGLGGWMGACLLFSNRTINKSVNP